MAIVDFALEHARQGRLVFPGIPNSKLPAIKDPYAQASSEETKIIQWWQENPNYNICLPGGYEIGPGKHIGFIDVDCKREGKNGFKTMADLEILGFEFPETLAQTTPTGGLHLFYYFDQPIQNSAGLLGLGIDTRGFHGYVIGAGSEINGKGYLFKNKLQIAQAPPWLVSRCRSVNGNPQLPGELVKLQLVLNVEQETAERAAIKFLSNLVPANEGERNRRGFEAACRCKDLGLTREHTRQCLAANWKCEPMLEPDELEQVVNSAYKYGQNTPGVDAPENAFDAIPEEPKGPKGRHPIDVLNDEYALVVQNGVHIIREIKIEGKYRVDHMSIQSFHDIQANNLITVTEQGKIKTVQVSKRWMQSPHRRQYDGIIFAPNKLSPRMYNLWRGFAVEMPTTPPKPEGQRALDLFLDHIRENVCGGNLEHARWVLGFFAHLIQKPEQKPRVALVLRGKKGVGKGVVTDCIASLLGDHSILTANRRYLSGNFNSHLENKLLLTLDEAFWSGDKAAEGILKDLITGSTQQIERKGHDSYQVANLLRIVIFGNEKWVVPATDDERRFAVFEVGEDKRGDQEYFGAIKDGMRDFGGDELLFKYLKEFDLTNVDVNMAPQTDALMSQKEHSLTPTQDWWLQCLKEGYVVGSSSEDWPADMSKMQARDALQNELESQNIRSRAPNLVHLSRELKTMCRSLDIDQRRSEGGIQYRVYTFPALETARNEWEKFIGGKVDWSS